MLNSFCCMRLNTAAVVIGWVGAAASFLTAVLLIFGLANIDELTKMVMENMSSQSANADEIRRLLVVVIAVQLAINVINLTASALLVAGTIKERHLMLMPWLINSGISVMIYGVYVIALISAVISSNLPLEAFINSLIYGILTLVLQFYIWYAIYSLYKQLQANRERQRLIQYPQQNSPSYTKM